MPTGAGLLLLLYHYPFRGRRGHRLGPEAALIVRQGVEKVCVAEVEDSVI